MGNARRDGQIRRACLMMVHLRWNLRGALLLVSRGHNG
jgi:hypothetical protein